MLAINALPSLNCHRLLGQLVLVSDYVKPSISLEGDTTSRRFCAQSHRPSQQSWPPSKQTGSSSWIWSKMSLFQHVDETQRNKSKNSTNFLTSVPREVPRAAAVWQQHKGWGEGFRFRMCTLSTVTLPLRMYGPASAVSPRLEYRRNVWA